MVTGETGGFHVIHPCLNQSVYGVYSSALALMFSLASPPPPTHSAESNVTFELSPCHVNWEFLHCKKESSILPPSWRRPCWRCGLCTLLHCLTRQGHTHNSIDRGNPRRTLVIRCEFTILSLFTLYHNNVHQEDNVHPSKPVSLCTWEKS